MVREFAWKFLCAIIKATNSSANSTLESSNAPDVTDPREAVRGAPITGSPDSND